MLRQSSEIRLQLNLVEVSILPCCKKRKVNYYACKNKRACTLLYSFYIPFNEQQKCHVTNIYTVEEKQKGEYIILSTNNKSVILQIFTRTVRKNKSIILHNGVLPNSPENVFLRPLSFLWKNHFILL